PAGTGVVRCLLGAVVADRVRGLCREHGHRDGPGAGTPCLLQRRILRYLRGGQLRTLRDAAWGVPCWPVPSSGQVACLRTGYATYGPKTMMPVTAAPAATTSTAAAARSLMSRILRSWPSRCNSATRSHIRSIAVFMI